MEDHLSSFMPRTTTMFGSIKESALGLITMDQTSYNLSFSNPSDSSSSYLNSSETYLTCLNPNLSQRYFQDEIDVKPLGASPLDYPLINTFFDDRTPMKRLVQVIEYLKESIRDVDILIQLWLPVPREGECVLTTEDQPFILNSESNGLFDYREISRSQLFATDEDSEAFFGLPSLVFLKKYPMCTPGFQFLEKEDDPRIAIGQQLNLGGCLHLPVFELGMSGTCLGIIEIVTTSQNVNYLDALDNVRKALEAFDLRSSEFFIHPKLEDCNGSYQVVLAEIREVLKSVCETHCLPLAQTWSLCAQQGRGGCQQQSATCISVISSASYVLDSNVLGFHEACCERHLLQGEGIAGKALGTNKPCFATDITAFCRMEYPLADHARMFGLGGAVAIRLRSTYMGPVDFILEFFLPHNCRNEEEQKRILSSISCVIQHVSRSLRVINDEELAGEDSSSVKETATQDESSWISHMLEAQKRGESFIVSMGSHKEEPKEEFKVINQPDYHEKSFYHRSALPVRAKQSEPNLGPKERRRSSGTRRSEEKRRVKAERNISFPVLQQYFPGSLKDAAKSIGVCPTTLKRICREHGIMRWPSRKIKKVGHSLKKLQLIIDSVQGAEGTIQLESFYTNFPELSSPVSPSLKPTNDCVNKSQKTSSFSSSCTSHNSGSTPRCSKENALYAEKPSGLVKRPAEEKLLIRTQKYTHVDYHRSNEVLVPLPISRDEGGFRIKAIYGEEKIRLSMSQHWGFEDLQREILRSFNIDDMDNVTLKYLDDDSEWVLLTCDEDLEECMDLSTSSKRCIIKLFLHQSFHPESGNSFTGDGPSYLL